MNSSDYAKAARAAVSGCPMMGAPTNASRIGALAVAYIEEVNAYWDWVRQQASSEDKKIMSLAIRLAEEAHPGQPELARMICAGTTHPPFYATVKRQGMRDPWTEPDKYTACVQMMLGDAKPLWVLYCDLAREQIAKTCAEPPKSS